MVTLLNTSILTAFGKYDYLPIDLGYVREIVAHEGFESAIGHASTAEILSELLGVSVPVNRVNYIQQPDTEAIVFKLKARAPEGVILSRAEIEGIGYEFGLLTRLE